LALAYHEILQPTNIQTERLGATLSSNLTGGRKDRMQKGVVHAKQGVYCMVSSLRGAAFDGAVLSRATWKRGLLIEGSVD
jgi:hypothetical protein